MTLDQVEAIGAEGWVVQLHIVAYEASAIDDLGLDVVPSGRLAAVLGDSVVNADVEVSLEAVLRAVRDRGDVHLIAEPLLLLGDGEQSIYERVQQVPYSREISDLSGGAIRSSRDIEFLDVGFSVSVSLREISSESASVDFSVSNSRIVDTSADLPPTTSVDKLESVLPVDSGGLYLVGGFDSTIMERRRSIGLRRSLMSSDELSRYQVWLRAYRVDGGISP